MDKLNQAVIDLAFLLVDHRLSSLRRLFNDDTDAGCVSSHPERTQLVAEVMEWGRLRELLVGLASPAVVRERAIQRMKDLNE